MKGMDLETIIGPYPDRVARIREVIDSQPPDLRDLAESVVIELAKAGISSEDMRHALDAVARIMRSENDAGWCVDPMDVTEFVATAAAVGNLSGPNLLLISSSLAHAARKVWRP